MWPEILVSISRFIFFGMLITCLKLESDGLCKQTFSSHTLRKQRVPIQSARLGRFFEREELSTRPTVSIDSPIGKLRTHWNCRTSKENTHRSDHEITFAIEEGVYRYQCELFNDRPRSPFEGTRIKLWADRQSHRHNPPGNFRWRLSRRAVA